MDVICAQCGEPWSYYGLHHGDFEREDIQPFLKGQHCPCCKYVPDRRKGAYTEAHLQSLEEADDMDGWLEALSPDDSNGPEENRPGREVMRID